jgi:DNA repair exonuclease SbcCD ATPase subunit
MRLNETALQRAKLDEERQTIEQLTRIKEGVQLLLDALERNMIRHQVCTSAEAKTLERQLADTSKALRDVLDLERHPNQPSEDWIPKLNRIEDALAKYVGFNRFQKIENQSNALSNLDLLFQQKHAFQEA